MLTILYHTSYTVMLFLRKVFPYNTLLSFHLLQHKGQRSEAQLIYLLNPLPCSHAAMLSILFNHNGFPFKILQACSDMLCQHLFICLKYASSNDSTQTSLRISVCSVTVPAMTILVVNFTMIHKSIVY